MSAAEHEPLDSEPEAEEVILSRLENEDQMMLEELRVETYNCGIGRSEYDEALEALRQDERIVTGIERVDGEVQPYVRLSEEY